MVRGVDNPVDRLATLVDRTLLSRVLAFKFSTTEGSLQVEIPTIIDPPRTQPFLAIALFACNLVCILTCIQFELGVITCCKTVPHVDSSESTKLTEEGGKPHTVIHVSKGVGSGEETTSWGVLLTGAGESILVCKLLGVAADRLGVNNREFVGGPPGLSLEDRGRELFSFNS